jgi:cell division protein FtsQ
MIREPWNYDRKSHKVILKVDNEWASKRSRKSKNINSNLLNHPRLFVLSVIVVVFSFLLLKEARSVLASNPQFVVQDIVIENSDNLITKEVINDILNIKAGETLLNISPKKTLQILKKDPDIEDVQAERIFPGTLKISIKERLPYAKLNIDGKTYLIDKSGVILGRERQCRDIPVISGCFQTAPVPGEIYKDNILKNILDVLYIGENMGWGNFIEITSIDVKSEKNIILHTRERILVRLNMDNLEERLKRLIAILEDSQKKEKIIKTVDLRFKDVYVE